MAAVDQNDPAVWVIILHISVMYEILKYHLIFSTANFYFNCLYSGASRMDQNKLNYFILGFPSTVSN